MPSVLLLSLDHQQSYRDVRLALSILHSTAKIVSETSARRVLWNLLEAIFVPVLECPWNYTKENDTKIVFLPEAEKQFLAFGKRFRHVCRENLEKITAGDMEAFEKFASTLVVCSVFFCSQLGSKKY